MSFSWSCIDKDGQSLFDKYAIHYQGLGLAPNAEADTPAMHRLVDIRSAFEGVAFKDEYEGAARAAITACQSMLRENLAALAPQHCPTCNCQPQNPNWDLAQIHRFLSIDISEVWRADGGW